MQNNKRIFLTGTMRTGGSLLINLLSIHPEILILNERIHFFRFVYGKYEPLNKKNIEMMLEHQRLRLFYRKGIDFDVKFLFDRIVRRGLTYPVIYDEMMNYFLSQSRKKIWGEYSALSWREIPEFINFFEDSKVIHVYRDPRAVLSSWKKLSSIPNYAYLNAIFNWIDSANYIKKYRASLSPSKYLAIKYEDIMQNPLKWVDILCQFIGVDFDKSILDSSQWSEKLSGNKLVNIPRSAHEGNNIVGFSTDRINNWQKHLKSWEIGLVEVLTHDHLKDLDYSFNDKLYEAKDIFDGIEKIQSNPLLLKNFYTFLSSSVGCDTYPTDPTLPSSWGAPGNPSEWFIDTPESKKYFKDLEVVTQNLSKKYDN